MNKERITVSKKSPNSLVDPSPPNHQNAYPKHKALNAASYPPEPTQNARPPRSLARSPSSPFFLDSREPRRHRSPVLDLAGHPNLAARRRRSSGSSPPRLIPSPMPRPRPPIAILG
jgi:hypothetical protein